MLKMIQNQNDNANDDSLKRYLYKCYPCTFANKNCQPQTINIKEGEKHLSKIR